MGYYTRYKLDVEPETDEVMEFLEQDGSCESYDCPLVSFMDRESESCKWYDHEIEMKRVSKKFPDILFTLSGEGEESGDIWRKYFKNGKVQLAQAKITFDKCKL